MPPITYDTDRFYELGDFEVEPTAVQALPRAFCRRACLVVLGTLEPDRTRPVTVGMLKPEDVVSIDEAMRLLNRPLRVVRLNRFEVDRALQIGFEGSPTGWDTEGSRPIPVPYKKVGPDSPVPELVDAMLVDAVQRKASDIHLEAYFQDVDVRLRIDGILHEVFTPFSPQNLPEAVSRIKILSGMDIAEKRRPQDGRFRCTFVEGGKPRPVDFRVSVVPGPAGEDVVIRILDANQGLLSVQQLGMSPEMLDVFKRLLANPEGLIVVTGPTSSGKTTTLYAALSYVTDDSRKIITAEDPIEYYIDRINQKQVTDHMSMMDLLRAALRQNPDVMLFGELRDMESANTAVGAAETGHLVLSTVHTSDALGVITRLRGIGLENTDIAATLLASLGQRLVRRVCRDCAAPHVPTVDQEKALGPLLQGRSFQKGRGCPTCRQTGFKGRIGVYELLTVDAEMQDAIHDGAPAHDILKLARRGGYRTMAEDALAKAAAGITTLDEVIRVIPYRQISTLRAERGTTAH